MASRKKAWIIVILLIIAVALSVLYLTKGASKPEKEEPVTEQVVQQPKVEEKPQVVIEPAVEPEPVVVEPEPEPEPVLEPGPVIIPEVEEPKQDEPKVPEAPDLDWLVITEEYVEPALNLYEEEENVDWSEFVFSDQEVVLPDGIYYATLFVNDSVFGTIEFEQRNSIPLFLKSDLQVELSGTLSALVQDRRRIHFRAHGRNLLQRENAQRYQASRKVFEKCESPHSRCGLACYSGVSAKATRRS